MRFFLKLLVSLFLFYLIDSLNRFFISYMFLALAKLSLASWIYKGLLAVFTISSLVLAWLLAGYILDFFSRD